MGRTGRSTSTSRTRRRVESPYGTIGAAYAARQPRPTFLDAETEPDLAALGDDLAAWLADLFRDR